VADGTRNDRAEPQQATHGPVLTPAGGISPRTALATSLQASPGVYAVLLGSGISSAAGIPTGWQIVEDLIQRIARVRDVDFDQLQTSPQSWWAKVSGSPPRYSSLLEELAPSPAARQALLRSFFEPLPDQPSSRQPTAAHRALAALCAGGFIRVIVTTNFDRLLEHALNEAGVAPQVIDSPTAAQTMTPLVHSRMTVVKLHGDYLATDLRNTLVELGEYPPEWHRLLTQILDDYGLLVVGWSAEHDVALASCITNVQSRRYPTYWGSRGGHLSEEASRIVQRREAHIIPLASADEFIVDLQEQVTRLATVAARRTTFTILRHPLNYPEQSATQWGWSAIPLLVLRTFALIAVADTDEVGVIGPEERERILDVLSSAAVMSSIRGLRSGFTPADPLTGNALELQSHIELEWTRTEGLQSIDYASYRWGGDVNTGVSVICSVTFPSRSRWGSFVGVTLDVGVSVEEPIPIQSIAHLFRDGLLLSALELPAAVANLLPLGSEVDRIECCLGASNFTGISDPGQRSNDLKQRVDWSAIEIPPADLAPLCGFAVRPGSALTGFNRSKQHRLVGASVDVRRGPRRVSSNQGSCEVGC